MTGHRSKGEILNKFEFASDQIKAKDLRRRHKRFEHCTIYAKRNWYDLSYGPERFRVVFHENRRNNQLPGSPKEQSSSFQSFSIKPLNNTAPSIDTLKWLSVLFGEDMFIVRETPDDSYQGLRGRLIYSQEHATNFLEKAYEWQRQNLSDPWKREVLNAAFGNLHIAIQGGLNYTPITQGIFLTCLEALSNVHNFDPNTYRKSKQRLGPKSFFMKDTPEDRAYRADLDALIAIRDITAAHFGAHQKREREKLTTALRKCFEVRHSYSDDYAAGSFNSHRILDDIQREAWWLYLMALTLCRVAFERMIGNCSVLYSEKDLWPLVFEAETACYHSVSEL